MPNVWAQAAVREAAERICQGEIVCIFSEAELGRSETLIRLSQGFELSQQYPRNRLFRFG